MKKLILSNNYQKDIKTIEQVIFLEQGLFVQFDKNKGYIFISFIK